MRTNKRAAATISLIARVSMRAAFCILVAGPAMAGRLEVEADAPLWARAGATGLLFLHIGGGALGLVAGTIASFTRKGGRTHRLWGRLFSAGMFVTYLIGAGVAPFLEEGQRPNFVAGVLALYLLATGIGAARRRKFVAGRAEAVGAAAAIAITGLGLLFMALGVRSPTGTVDGSPPQAFVVFVLAGGAAAIGDVRVLAKRTLSNTQRIERHLWRMCASFFFASGSLFIGQPQIFPAWFVGSGFQFLLSFGPIFIMLGWIVGGRIEARRRQGSSCKRFLAIVPLSFMFAGIGLSRSGIFPAMYGWGLVALGGLLGLAASILIFRRVRKGQSDLRIFGILAALPLVVLLPIVVHDLSYPRINDVTTDVENPLAFVVALEAPANSRRDMTYPEHFGPIVREAYPDVRPLLLDESPERVYRRVVELAEVQSGWEIKSRDAEKGRVEGEVSTPFFRFVDDFVLRVSDQGGRARVDMRSKSREGLVDAGVNAKRIQSFFADLADEF